MKNMFQTLALIVAIIAMSLVSMAQDLNISGNVSDKNGSPISSVLVIVKGTLPQAVRGLQHSRYPDIFGIRHGNIEKAVEGRGRIDVIMKKQSALKKLFSEDKTDNKK
jgi:hypothetical protein